MEIKTLITKLRDNLLIPICTILICYFLFSERLRDLPCANLIRLLVFGSAILFAICAWLSLVIDRAWIKKSIEGPKNRKLVTLLLFYSEHIVNYFFYIYFSVYMVLELDKSSVVYNYILLLSFGMFLGYRFSIKSNLRESS